MENNPQMISVADLFTAAQQARRFSSVNGDKVICIALTEEGFVITGNEGERSTAIDLSWSDMDTNPALLMNAVFLVDEILAGKGADRA